MALKVYSFLLFFSLSSSLVSSQPGAIIHGRVSDDKNNPLPYASISVPAKGMGTMSNKTGSFILNLPAGFGKDTLVISFLGYEPKKIAFSEIDRSAVLAIALTQKEVVLEEVVVRPIDPLQLIRSAIAAIPANYHPSSHITNGFYRLDTKKGDEHIMLSEAVFDIYNSAMLQKRKTSSS